MYVHPWRLDVYIDKEPLSSSTFPTALEGSFEVFLPTVATKIQSNPREDDFLIPRRGIEVSE
jgi:hypothetical protein